VGTTGHVTQQPNVPALVELHLERVHLHLVFVVSSVSPVDHLAAKTTPMQSSHPSQQVQILTLVNTLSASPAQMFANSG
jgi:hypothetical protein